MDLPARFINHSCEANVGITDNNLGAFDFYAIMSIRQGEELTWVRAQKLCVLMLLLPNSCGMSGLWRC